MKEGMGDWEKKAERIFFKMVHLEERTELNEMNSYRMM